MGIHFGRQLARTIVIAAVLLAFSGVAQAWEAPYVEQGIKRAVAAARKLKDLSGFTCRSDGVCLIGGFIENDKEITWSAGLKGGKEYIFVGAADEDVKDLDLAAYEGKNLVAKDDAEDNTPVVLIKAESDATCTLHMKVAKAPGEGQKHFCVMIMLESDGHGAKLSQLEGAAKELNKGCAKINDKGNLQFDQAANSVCLVAGLIESGESKTFERNFEKGQKYLMIGCGDENCADLDLEVTHEGEVVAKDEDNDPTPVVGISVGDEHARCKVKMTMHDAKAPSFAIVAILTPAE